jgi:hypothetical protein
MPLIGGTVSVTAGVATGTGLAKAIYDALRSAQGIDAGPQNHAGLVEMGKVSTALGTTIVDYLKTNATITAAATLTVPSGIAVTCPPYSGATVAPGTATGTVTSTLT